MRCKNEARGVSSEPIVSAVESCDCVRDIENLNCVAYAKAAGTADRRPCEAIAAVCTLVKTLF